MKKKKVTKPHIPISKKLMVLIPFRATEKERKLIKNAAMKSGDFYMTRWMRQVILEKLGIKK